MNFVIITWNISYYLGLDRFKSRLLDKFIALMTVSSLSIAEVKSVLISNDTLYLQESSYNVTKYSKDTYCAETPAWRRRSPIT